MKKNILLSALTILLTVVTYGQNVNIPDVNFKNYLISNTLINTNNDTEIQLTEAQSFTGTISCTGLNITDLTGIESFTALTHLDCYDNQLTSLNVSQNTALTTLYFDNNLITSIDVTQNVALTKLGFGNNQLTSINLAQNTALTKLICNKNQLTSLDLSNNAVLATLGCYQNQLTSLNLKNGNNASIVQMTTINNPNLTCIQVDDATYSTNTWTSPNAFSFDNGISFSENCNSTANTNSLNGNKNTINVFPNPAKNQINFSVQVNIQLTNITGQIIRNEVNVNSIDISEQPDGVYFATFTSDNGEILQRSKIVKD